MRPHMAGVDVSSTGPSGTALGEEGGGRTVVNDLRTNVANVRMSLTAK